ncbi:MAG TPA: sigma-54-dependent Fis family transcriptional regulator [Planctomycetes bacterium]|nr:sigma-54-dependent Fis family transcriptional regulator [Planctomycetota bacterium]
MTLPPAMPTPREHDSGLEGLRVLVVDDEEDIRLGLKKLLGSLGGQIRAAADGEEALRIVQTEGADVILTDLMMPRMGGQELLVAVKERSPETAVVILTGFGTIQAAVSSLHAGAAHFMIKPFENAEVLSLVSRLGRQVLAQRASMADRDGGGGPDLVAEDPAMREVLELVHRVAPSPVPVLIEGASGTGKEVIARTVHARSQVSDRPFQAVNAAALPDTLLESELFGHVRGSFTGADRDRKGIFREARGGSVFLDEVASMSPSFQGKLLRVLQEKRVRPLGSSRDEPVDFRLIAATNRDLEAMFRSGEFREDLFYRLGVVRIRLPLLKDRPADILPIAMRFLSRAAETCIGEGAAARFHFSPAAVEALEGHSWPGNVRELENALYRAVIVCRDGKIQPHHLGLEGEPWSRRDEGDETEEVPYAEGKQRAIERFQREFVRRALEAAEGNISRAAERCGLTRAALQRIMRQHGIEREAFRNP